MRILLVALLVLIAIDGHAEIYKYTDSKGELHFVDDLEKVPVKYRKKVKDSRNLPAVSVMESRSGRSGGEPAKAASAATGVVSQEQFSGTVDLYVTSWCGYCKKMEEFLASKGIPFRKLDIEADASAAEAFQKLGGGGVPVARIGTNVVRGYNPDAVLRYTGKR